MIWISLSRRSSHHMHCLTSDFLHVEFKPRKSDTKPTQSDHKAGVRWHALFSRDYNVASASRRINHLVKQPIAPFYVLIPAIMRLLRAHQPFRKLG
ncbi:hypothetical protein LIA77_00539 [Sarocladium implicatum]|nr:hypothetical protein LIA77_00539 [Sarocladium implicatum]